MSTANDDCVHLGVEEFRLTSERRRPRLVQRTKKCVKRTFSAAELCLLVFAEQMALWTKTQIGALTVAGSGVAALASAYALKPKKVKQIEREEHCPVMSDAPFNAPLNAPPQYPALAPAAVQPQEFSDSSKVQAQTPRSAVQSSAEAEIQKRELLEKVLRECECERACLQRADANTKKIRESEERERVRREMLENHKRMQERQKALKPKDEGLSVALVFQPRLTKY